MYTKYSFHSFDKYFFEIHLFECKNPRGVIQFIHGMCEYQDRYEPFFNYLQENNYNVVSINLRGHGKDAEILGHFGNRKGYKTLIKDQQVIYRFIKDKYPNLPIYLFGHSMGTIIARNLLKTDSLNYQKIVLSGYPNYESATPIGKCLAKTIKIFKGPYYRSHMLVNLSLGSYNKAINNPTSDFDWLSYNPKNVNKYIDDPLCGYTFTTSGFIDLFQLCIGMHSVKKCTNINNNLEFLLISGKEDPCTGGEKGRLSSIKTLNKQGFNRIEIKTFNHMRHEILNEVDNLDVYKVILDFLNK